MKKLTALLLTALLIISAAGCANNPAVQPDAARPERRFSESAQRLYDYICETYHSHILSGQQESTWMGSEQYEFDYISEKTGRLPAIRGLDYMNDDFDGVDRRAEEWYERGGIVSICWHCGSDFSGSWEESQKTVITDWDKALTPGTAENEALLAGMDKGAEALKKLRDMDIPVLWRPFHEFDGGWFWWGKGGAENFRKLWITMYERYTDYHGLDNLIWVLGFSHLDLFAEGWYPGNEYVDIAGADSYSKGANHHLYEMADRLTPDYMPLCFHECGTVPTVRELRSAPTDWVWFLTWHTNYITDENDPGTLSEIYNDEYVITLDELPDLRNKAGGAE
ncbi:MAG: glycoside hydrolase family 26 protein [Ruminiclostridium sp.]|nr:glycoside hydrolase family 26 protein [Ruminiclostridium sp.]